MTPIRRRGLCPPVNNPIIRITRADNLRDRIADAILSGELEPGSRLDEQALAARFAVSRTPVREALKQLAAIDLVDVRPHRGAIVAELPPERLAELFEALAEVEAVCARLAAVKMSIIERERLDELDAECQAAMASGVLEAVYATNKAFHDAIYSGSHNGFLVEQAFALRRRLSPLSRAQFRRTGRPHDFRPRARPRHGGDPGARRRCRRGGDAPPHPQRRPRLLGLRGRARARRGDTLKTRAESTPASACSGNAGHIGRRNSLEWQNRPAVTPRLDRGAYLHASGCGRDGSRGHAAG